MTEETRSRIEEGIRDWSNTESEVRKRLEAAQEKWNKALQPLEDAITNSDYAHVPFKIVGTRRIRYRYIGPLRPRKISLEDDDRMTESIEWVYDHLICEFDHYDCCLVGLVEHEGKRYLAELIDENDPQSQYTIREIDWTSECDLYLFEYRIAYRHWFHDEEQRYQDDGKPKDWFKAKWHGRNPIIEQARKSDDLGV